MRSLVIVCVVSIIMVSSAYPYGMPGMGGGFNPNRLQNYGTPGLGPKNLGGFGGAQRGFASLNSFNSPMSDLGASGMPSRFGRANGLAALLPILMRMNSFGYENGVFDA
ncbi:hypothetical protein SNE40_009934 [Patella caerulea]|uniref:Uncharacterized protein n=1 Tax=Patella caerulea TaxID=87958 RepID=A0AAN8PQZ0_PATCE